MRMIVPKNTKTIKFIICILLLLITILSCKNREPGNPLIVKAALFLKKGRKIKPLARLNWKRQVIVWLNPKKTLKRLKRRPQKSYANDAARIRLFIKIALTVQLVYMA